VITLSAFADEVSPNLEEALRVLKEAGLATMELRGFDKTNVTKLTEAQVRHAEALLAREGFAVGSIATPIGKVEITDAFEPQAGMLKRSLDLARRLGSSHVRIFSFYLPKSDGDRKTWKKETVTRLKRLAEAAEGTGVTLVLENEEGLWGDTVDRCVELIDAVKAPHLKLAFDPCNLVIVGPRPFTDGWKAARKHLGYLHVKDWKRDSRQMVPAGEGDAEWPQLASALKAARWSGIVALEPHLVSAGRFAGFTGADLFRKAHAALTGLLARAGLEYR
jgi:3-dehydroshikimate dehydratase